ncbi:MAG TPA: hypothetical protein VJ714_00245, partial [Anaerolineae bacterium]|nr:hypothetical protein [Anaerolineae bacterium]
ARTLSLLIIVSSETQHCGRDGDICGPEVVGPTVALTRCAVFRCFLGLLRPSAEAGATAFPTDRPQSSRNLG